ncbi:ABC transporter substrate-binding protein [Vreelandella massiliensis]|uniref:ABC transporter substrate-binding protein n=1 Tax=Vreelandella massiliensis TaxID=1816686 RepID=UPI00096A733A|nr:ABC transporter substrate-binding protein [Halomonas massiliensis]MYL22352.1 glycine/betaine ABC transporter [Halomonas alkaliantarctica]
MTCSRWVSAATASGFLLSSMLLSAPSLAQDNAETVRFAVPAWPGVTVKTALTAQLLEALGYEVRQQELGSTITYEAMNQGEIDAFMAAWLPAQNGMYETAMARDTIVDLGNNVDGARLGFAVPTYVYDAGLTSAAQFANEAFAERLDQTIYSIEVGSGMSDLLNAAVDDDVYGLGDWKLSETSTPGMLSAAADAINRDEWIVFAGWTPHWMNIEYDIRYLDDPENIWGESGGRSDVKTLVTRDFYAANPNATRLLDQIAFSAEDQSAMIYGFSYEEREPEQVALEWMRDNPERVQAFLEGVTTTEGSAAWEAVNTQLKLEAE